MRLNKIMIRKIHWGGALVAFFLFFSLYLTSFAAVSLSQDTNLSLTGISDGDLLAASGSSADYLSFSGAELTVSAVPNSSYFTLKTPAYANALKITPSGGTATLTFNSSNLSSGAITAWTLNASASDTTIAHTVSASSANTWYQISVGGTAYNSYQTNSSGELTFTYSGGFASSKLFTIIQDNSAPTSFSLVSPVNNYSDSDSRPTFTWNASSDPDLSHYQLYINNNLDTNNITTASVTPSGFLSCGAHTWYVKVVDKAGLSTNSETFNYTVTCSGGGGRIRPLKPSSSSSSSSLSNQQNEFFLINSTKSNQTPTHRFFKLLKFGSKGDDVAELQKRLIFEGVYTGPVTGFYGSMTREGVRRYQAKNNLPSVGAVGPMTLSVLNASASNISSSSSSSSQGFTLVQLIELLINLDIIAPDKVDLARTTLKTMEGD